MSEQLQRLADRLCRIFCGRKLRRDRRTLTALGSGKLEVDLLKKTCRFERDYVSKLAILEELVRELRLGLKAYEVTPGTIRSAILTATLTLEEHEDQRDKSVMWFGERDGFVGCEMEIRSTVRTSHKNYKSEHRGYVEWPRVGELDP